jgi:hypothetical protein
VSYQPKIVNLGMYDTDYASMVESEPVPENLRQRLSEEEYDVSYISKQARRYRYAKTQEARDDLLCKIASKAGLFTLADMEIIDDRTRMDGFFRLENDERQQVINWLYDEMSINISKDEGA